MSSREKPFSEAAMIVPAIMRTILYKKPSAAIFICTISPNLEISQYFTVLTVSEIFDPSDINARKSCLPQKACAAKESELASSGLG